MSGLTFRFIGLILLPLVGNAAEHVTSIWMACKGKMELTIGVAVGSSIQIAAGMIPLLVIIAWPMHRDLTLFFANFETIVLFVSVMLVNLLLQDGEWGSPGRETVVDILRSHQLHGRTYA